MSRSKKYKTHFNFRIATELEKLPEGIKLNRQPERIYHIIECYYTDGKESAYHKGNLLANWESKDDLITTYWYIADAFKKPILDLDNWPHEFKNEQHEYNLEEPKSKPK